LKNPYLSHPAKIIKIIPQAANIKLFRFKFVREGRYHFAPGQIIELSIPGFGEAPFAPCGAPDKEYFELCIRNVGKLTDRLHAMKVGDTVGIRGPYGNGWPISYNKKHITENKNLLIVVGGLGLVPLRTLILGKDKYLGKNTKVQIFYGARTPADFLFRDEYDAWRKYGIVIDLTIDKECAGWHDCVGLVTTLFDKKRVVNNAQAYLCGPPIMYKFVLEQLKTKHFADKDIYVSLERRMHCGLGVCQHCAVGHLYTCKDGPVFQYEQIKNIEGAI